MALLLLKREQVEAFLSRAFSRVTQAGDLLIPLNDAEFIAIQPNLSRLGRAGRQLAPAAGDPHLLPRRGRPRPTCASSG